MTGLLIIAGVLGWMIWCFILTPTSKQPDYYYLSPFDEGWDTELNARAAHEIEAILTATEVDSVAIRAEKVAPAPAEAKH